MARKPAFSLVELLVTIAILALLIGILLPSLRGARAQARLVKCQANLRSIGQLMTIYAAENAGRIPRGPSHAGHPDPLLAPDVATSQVWLGTPFNGTPWTSYLTNGGVLSPSAPIEAQFVGLGLLTRSSGSAGNEFLYCPSSDLLHADVDGARIGRPNNDAFGSYLYRQLDLMAPDLFMTGRLDQLYGVSASGGSSGNSGTGGGNDCGFLADPTDPSSLSFLNVAIEALALDYNSSGETSSNHDGRELNVLYRDISVKSFDNDHQTVQNTPLGIGMIPWGTVRRPLGAPTAAVQAELDRVLGTADLGYRSDAPWSYSPQ